MSWAKPNQFAFSHNAFFSHNDWTIYTGSRKRFSINWNHFKKYCNKLAEVSKVDRQDRYQKWRQIFHKLTDRHHNCGHIFQK